MRLRLAALLLAPALCLAASSAVRTQSPARGQRLQDLSWPEAERVLTSDAVVVIPLGAGSKEHGPHLKLGNDHKLAEYLTSRLVDTAPVIVAPTVPYHYYPAFLEYPGSTSLAFETAREHTVEVARSLARYGPRRF
jgi:creatinine amidohydrolase